MLYIAEQQGITKEELVAYNTVLIGTNYALYPGQSIKIPTAPPEPAHQPIASPSLNTQKSKKPITIASRSDESGKIGSFSWPLTGIITSNYGTRWGRMHNGIDIFQFGQIKGQNQSCTGRSCH